jgi:hypothetical protein
LGQTHAKLGYLGMTREGVEPCKSAARSDDRGIADIGKPGVNHKGHEGTQGENPCAIRTILRGTYADLGSDGMTSAKSFEILVEGEGGACASGRETGMAALWHYC